MKSPIDRLVLIWLLALLVFSLFACTTPAGRSAGQVVDDATITTKVKASLFDDPTLSGFSIGVETFQGEVTLTGAVDTWQEKRRAASVAKSTRGVRKVNNLLKIKE
ncbi:MAG: BON domain-containing protein [Desulfobacteraceae bacterium]|jgi:hyperosmotically inducible protein|nr:BON domain-containing protein [Desulfobacteraceae bacterium]